MPFKNFTAPLSLILILTGIALYLSYLVAAPFLGPLLTAVVLAIAFFPLHVRMERRVHGRGNAAFASLLVIVLAVLVPVALIAFVATIQLHGLVDAIGRRTAEGGGLDAYATAQVDRLIAWAGHYVDVSRLDLQDQMLGRLQNWSGALMGTAGGLLSDLTTFLANGLLVLILMFFVFRDGRAIRDYLARTLPLRASQLERLSDGVGNTIQASMFGILAVALAQAALLGIGFWILGIQGSVFWAAATIFASLIPIVGAATIWLPAAVWLLATGSWIKALILVAWGVGGIGMIDNILRPYVMSGRVELHPLLLAFAILGGVQAFGMIGLFAGPVILAVTRTLFELLGEELTALRLRTGQQQE